MGAWPVTGFCGLEILLLYIAFRLNYRSGRAYETVRLTQTDLEIRRFGPRGDEVAHWTFEPTSLPVSMDDPPRHDSRLPLPSHGHPPAIGGSHPRHERREELRTASGRCRVFGYVVGYVG